jgi:hypothetical protein
MAAIAGRAAAFCGGGQWRLRAVRVDVLQVLKGKCCKAEKDRFEPKLADRCLAAKARCVSLQ